MQNKSVIEDPIQVRSSGSVRSETSPERGKQNLFMLNKSRFDELKH